MGGGGGASLPSHLPPHPCTTFPVSRPSDGTILFPALQMPMEIFQCITVRSREQRLSLQMASPLLFQALRFNVYKVKTGSSNCPFP